MGLTDIGFIVTILTMNATPKNHPDTPGLLEGIFASKWGVPVITGLDALHGAKYVTLSSRLGVSRASVLRAVQTLIDSGVVRQNPGYGHPLRPEVVLTDLGVQIAPACSELRERIQNHPVSVVALKKWTMPVLHSVQSGAERFGDIRGSLPCATDRALVIALRDLQGVAMVRRKIENGYPPRPLYTQAPPAMIFRDILREIAEAA